MKVVYRDFSNLNISMSKLIELMNKFIDDNVRMDSIINVETIYDNGYEVIRLWYKK